MSDKNHRHDAAMAVIATIASDLADMSRAAETLCKPEQARLFWKMHVRLCSAHEPRYVVVENVAALLARGMGVVIGDLARVGYDAEWSVISACSMGAPHVRRR